MSMFKKTKLAAAIASAGCALIAGQASAVYVNEDGLGQALIYPYYTVRGDNMTLLSVVNTTNNAKIVKVRFREGKNTSDVLDFNLFLSREDVWTGAVLPTADRGNGTGGAVLLSADTSCVTPTSDEAGNTFKTGIPFRIFDLPTDNDDAATDTVDRLREGYVEIIELATVPNASPLGLDVTHNNGSATVARTPTCSLVAGLTSANARTRGQTTSNTIDNLAAPSGGLFGAATYLNAPVGGATSVEAVALADFWGSVNRAGRYDLPSVDTPNLGSGEARSVVVNGTDVYISNWSVGDGLDGFRATTAVLMRDGVYNEYAYTNDKVFSTDWVVTMPSKRYFVNQGIYQLLPGVGPFYYYAAEAPFQRAYRTGTGSCDDVSLASYDREEGRGGGSGASFSPVRPGAAPNALCWEANVISIGNATAADEPSRVLGSTNNLWFRAYQNNGQAVGSVGAAPQGEGGWAKLSFQQGSTITNNHQLVNNLGSNTVVSTAGVSNVASVTYNGLPVIGFSATIANQGARASYGTSVKHRYSRTITAGTVVTP